MLNSLVYPVIGKLKGKIGYVAKIDDEGLYLLKDEDESIIGWFRPEDVVQYEDIESYMEMQRNNYVA